MEIFDPSLNLNSDPQLSYYSPKSTAVDHLSSSQIFYPSFYLSWFDLTFTTNFASHFCSHWPKRPKRTINQKKSTNRKGAFQAKSPLNQFIKDLRYSKIDRFEHKWSSNDLKFASFLPYSQNIDRLNLNCFFIAYYNL